MPQDCSTDQNQCLESKNISFHSGMQKNPCIRTVGLLNTWINYGIDYLCSVGEGFYCYGIQKMVGFYVLVILHKYKKIPELSLMTFNSFINLLWCYSFI